MCYDDLDLEDINWKDLLELEGDEEVDASIREYDPFLCQNMNWHNGG